MIALPLLASLAFGIAIRRFLVASTARTAVASVPPGLGSLEVRLVRHRSALRSCYSALFLSHTEVINVVSAWFRGRRLFSTSMPSCETFCTTPTESQTCLKACSMW
jgi:hypothetical protein